ncbi:hypothetical protein [Streptomyces brasiliensis]|uniref:Uncharacterized protein n=1 Tax=Streptomyces brasiliensis TaxID=1954 RepID=A0A917KVG8_9ACTN|nr:hypothetical protein [Streptomyces brasiliensis]GGJ32111.1 hypothetical protein GCM10010121_049110 [Streptomyces brasiliensis]
MRSWTSAAVATAMVLAGLTTVGTATAATAEPQGSVLTAEPLPTIGGDLLDSYQVNDHTTWAFGMHRGVEQSDTPLLLSKDDRDGQGWREVPLPAYSGDPNELHGASAVPGSDGDDAWLVGMSDSVNLHGLLTEHWDGQAWQTVTAPLPESSHFGNLTSVSAIASDDVWAVGWADVVDGKVPDPDKPGAWITTEHREGLAERWDGSAWQRVALPDAADFYAISVVSRGADDIWVGGYTGEDTPALKHFDGQKWSSVDLPSTGVNGEIYDMAVDQDGSLWAAGRTLLKESDTGHALLLHQVGGVWSKVGTPPVLRLIKKLVPTPGGVAVAAENRNSGDSYAMRLDAGRWGRPALPSADGQVRWINGLSVAPGGRLDVVGAVADAGGDPDTQKPLGYSGKL